MKGIVAMAAACLLVPALALAQNPQRPQPASSTAAQPNRAATTDTSGRNARTVTSSTGEVTGGNAAVPAQALAEQQDPKLIGSPAWWKNHSTADGKPLH